MTDIGDDVDMQEQEQDDYENMSDSDTEESESLDDGDVDELLEQALPEDFRRTPKRRKLMPQEHDIIRNLVCSGSNGKSQNQDSKDYDSVQAEIEAGELGDEDNDKDGNANKFKEKVVTILEEKGKNKFDDLPGGWIQVRHVSGMPIFLHRKTRVCTLAKPYRLGPGSARRHSMPMSAIPCYAYRKALEKESMESKESSFNSAPLLRPNNGASYNDNSNGNGAQTIPLIRLFETEKIAGEKVREKDRAKSTEAVEAPIDDLCLRQLFSTPPKSRIPSIFSTPSDNGIEVSPSSPQNLFESMPVLPQVASTNQTGIDMEDELEPGEILDDDDEDQKGSFQGFKNDLNGDNFIKSEKVSNSKSKPKISPNQNTACNGASLASTLESSENLPLPANGTPMDQSHEVSDRNFSVQENDRSRNYNTSDNTNGNSSIQSHSLDHTNGGKCPKTSIQQRLHLFLDNKLLDNSTNSFLNGAVNNLIPKAQVETAQEAHELNSVSPEALREYCMKLFKFKQVKCKKFKSWSDRRKHAKEQKRLHLQRPTLPDGVQLITFPVQRPVGDADSGKIMKEYTMNPQGKSSVCILHEYVQHALRMQPSYSFGEIRNSAAPYAATVMINNVQYGSGYGTSKKIAKAAAATATLEILIPKMKDVLKSNGNSNNELYHIGYFDQIEMDDPRIQKMCVSVSEPSPYALLLACLQRNFGQGSTSDIKFEVVSTGSQANRFRMQTGEYSVEVTASNKREGKQLASQALLCKIHPHIKNFGSFLRLYGNGSIKSVKEKKQEEQQITTLQSKASANSPNYAILNKLKEEMLKLRGKTNEEKNQLIHSSTSESQSQEPGKPVSLVVS